MPRLSLFDASMFVIVVVLVVSSLNDSAIFVFRSQQLQLPAIDRIESKGNRALLIITQMNLF